MKCNHCASSFSADCYSPAPGGYSAPGKIFAVNIVVLVGLIVAILYLPGIVVLALAFVQLISVCANLTSWMDSNSHMLPDGTAAKGIICPSCEHINPVRPWSL